MPKYQDYEYIVMIWLRKVEFLTDYVSIAANFDFVGRTTFPTPVNQTQWPLGVTVVDHLLLY